MKGEKNKVTIESVNPKSIFSGIGLMNKVFANGPGDRGSIPGRVIPRTQKWYLIHPSLTQHYKVRIKGKVEQSREWSSAFLYTSML